MGLLEISLFFLRHGTDVLGSGVFGQEWCSSTPDREEKRTGTRFKRERRRFRQVKHWDDRMGEWAERLAWTDLFTQWTDAGPVQRDLL